MKDVAKFTVNWIGAYFLFPIYVASILLFFFFHVPTSFYFGIFSLLIFITVPILLINKIYSQKLNLQKSFSIIKEKKQFRITILLFCSWIVLCGFADIYVNGLKLLDPAHYSIFNGDGRYIRHNSTLCWMLIPVAFIFIRSWRIKSLFIAYAIIFPILIVDRNRFFISFYSLIMCFLCTNTSLQSFKKKKMSMIVVSGMIFCCLTSFAILGKVRSGDAFLVHSSGRELVQNEYPLRDSFSHLPPLMQQIIIYMTSPVFNFTTVVAKDFKNPEFLLSQLSPLDRSSFNINPYAPVLIPRFNVGTEFYPFVLYGGLGLVFISFLFMYIITLFFSYLFQKSPNIFTYLIFIKLSYGALFMGFGPQFYILYNLLVILLVLLIWSGSIYLKKFIYMNGTYRIINDKQNSTIFS